MIPCVLITFGHYLLIISFSSPAHVQTLSCVKIAVTPLFLTAHVQSVFPGRNRFRVSWKEGHIKIVYTLYKQVHNKCSNF